MPEFIIRTVNSFFVTEDAVVDYGDEIQARAAAFRAAGKVAYTDFLAGERANTVLGEVLGDAGNVIHRVAVTMAAADLATVT